MVRFWCGERVMGVWGFVRFVVRLVVSGSGGFVCWTGLRVLGGVRFGDWVVAGG